MWLSCFKKIGGTGQTDGQRRTDGQGATLTAAPREGGPAHNNGTSEDCAILCVRDY